MIQHSQAVQCLFWVLTFFWVNLILDRLLATLIKLSIRNIFQESKLFILRNCSASVNTTHVERAVTSVVRAITRNPGDQEPFLLGTNVRVSVHSGLDCFIKAYYFLVWGCFSYIFILIPKKNVKLLTAFMGLYKGREPTSNCNY